jgi:hypothetical protein
VAKIDSTVLTDSEKRLLVILDAFSDFDALLGDSMSQTEVWAELAGDDASGPKWPHVVLAMMGRLEAGAEQLQALVRQGVGHVPAD